MNKQLNVVIIILLIIVSAEGDESILSTEYFISDNVVQVKISIAEPRQAVYMPINQFRPFSIVSPEIFHTNKSESGSYQNDEQIPINNQILEVFEYKDIATFLVDAQNKYSVNFYFYILPSGLSASQNDYIGFGFAYKFRNEKFSLVHQLRRNERIKRLSFAIVPNPPNEFENGNVYFGGLPNKVRNNFRYKASCNIDKSKTEWGCYIDKLIFDHGSSEGDSITFNSFAYFSSAADKIILPIKDFEKLKKGKFFGRLFEKGLCSVFSTLTDNFFNCDIEAIIPIRNDKILSFVIGGQLFDFRLSSLFRCSKRRCDSLFASSTKYGNFWVLGNLFLLKYATDFDYEEGKVEFFSNSPFDIISTKNNYLIYFFNANLILLLIGNIIVFFIKKNFRLI